MSAQEGPLAQAIPTQITPTQMTPEQIAPDQISADQSMAAGGAPAQRMTDLHRLAEAVEPGADKPGVKRVMVEDGARVVVFTFAAGQGLAEHKAAFPILVQSIAGHIQFTADGHTTDLRPGDLAHLSARLPHAVHAVTDATLQLVMLDPKARSSEQA